MTQEFVTLPREVVEQALKALNYEKEANINNPLDLLHNKTVTALRAALGQLKNHVPGAGNMATAGWKLVPVEPTRGMLDAAHKDLVRDAEIDMMLKGIHSAMIAAAPQPPTTEDSSVVHPQANQPAITPIAQRKLDSLLAEGYTISGYSVYHERKHQHGFVTGAGLVGWWKPEGVEYPQPQGDQGVVGFVRQVDIEHLGNTPSDWASMFGQATGYNTVPVYTRPQPKLEPLTDAQIADAVRGFYSSDEAAKLGFPDDVCTARATERAHNIK